MNESFLNNLDQTAFEETLNSTHQNVQYFENIVDSVVNEYVGVLDRIMDEIDINIVKVDNPPLTVLTKHFLELSNTLYFISSKSEKLGIYNTLSKLAAKDVYNKAFLENSTKQIEVNGKLKTPTAADNQSAAENASLYETTINTLYDRAYAIVKNKIGAAQSMLSSLSKTISTLTTEMQLSVTQNSKESKVLNEEF